MQAVSDAGAARLGAGAAQPGPAGSRPDVDSESMEDLLEWEMQMAEGVRAVPPPFAPGRLRAEMAGSGSSINSNISRTLWQTSAFL